MLVIIPKHTEIQGIIQIGSIVPLRIGGVPVSTFINRVRIQDRARGVTRARVREAAVDIPVPHGAGAFMMFVPMTVIRTVAVIVAVLVVMTVTPNRALMANGVEADGTTSLVPVGTARGIVSSMVMLRAPMYRAGGYWWRRSGHREQKRHEQESEQSRLDEIHYLTSKSASTTTWRRSSRNSTR